MRDDLFDVHADIEDRHWWFVARRQILRSIADAVLPTTPASVVLDIGCGTGANAAAFTNDHQVVGLDPHAEGIAHARRRFPDATFINGSTPHDVTDVLPNVRLALLTDVIEHLPDDFEAVSTWLAALPVGSHLLITVPADPALWSRHDEVFGHYRRYTVDRLAAVWAGLPVTCRLHSPFNSRLYPVVKAIRHWRRMRGGTERGDDFKIGNPTTNSALRRVFAGEAAALRRSLDGPSRPYRHGVSQIALLRRKAGPLTVRTRPAEISADVHNPSEPHL